jgi:hypothetical protein
MLHRNSMNFLSRAFAWFAVPALVGMAAGSLTTHAAAGESGEAQFLLTAQKYESLTVRDKTCESEFGKGSQVVDWRDI